MPACAGMTVVGTLIPRLFRRRILPSDFSGDEALGDVSRFHVKMAVDGADLAGDVEAGDWLFHWVEDALLVFRSVQATRH